MDPQATKELMDMQTKRAVTRLCKAARRIHHSLSIAEAMATSAEWQYAEVSVVTLTKDLAALRSALDAVDQVIKKD